MLSKSTKAEAIEISSGSSVPYICSEQLLRFDLASYSLTSVADLMQLKFLVNRTLTAGAGTFSLRKNKISKCCDISLELLMVKSSPQNWVERWDNFRTFKGTGKREWKMCPPQSEQRKPLYIRRKEVVLAEGALYRTCFSLRFPYSVFAAYKGNEKSRLFWNTFFRPEKEPAPAVIEYLSSCFHRKLSWLRKVASRCTYGFSTTWDQKQVGSIKEL